MEAALTVLATLVLLLGTLGHGGALPGESPGRPRLTWVIPVVDVSGY
ncbi:hypothetical protein E2C01_048786 [Portunus trituberculatus]|uniref:Uncharacterized protein n=1 Tax=Portunus trituberculatus TaxID=210409 RepID=A0A5B7GC46_PORTR|nr:hypothetical protein [Portunus trituberculatus]